jgi:putative ABC transport system permease protein
MIRNYFTIAWRNLRNNILFSTLNVLGLSIGMGACLVTGLFAYEQYHYDVHHKNSDRIYRVVNRQVEGNSSSYVAVTQGVLAPELVKSFPEIEQATRVGFTTTSLIRDNQEPVQEKLMAVDPAYFSIFTIPFKKAPAGAPLREDGILISENAARRLFGEKNPIGETVSMGNEIHLKVTGVFENFPYQTHLSTEFIISFSWLEKLEPQAISWSSNSYYNYLLMPDAFDKKAFDKKMDMFIHQYTPASWKTFEYFLQPIRSINLQAGYLANPRGGVGKVLVNGFIMVSIIILLLASFNYMNMATARSARRAIEVGIRKVVGAQRSQVVRQFLMESFTLCSLGFLLAVLWADVGLQYFNYYTGFKLSFQVFYTDAILLLWVLAALIIVTIVSGGYPAFFLSRFMPAAVLKGQRSSDSSRKLRKGLVLFQFSLTSLLIVLVILVSKQTEFMRKKDLGFNKEHLLLFAGNRSKDIGLESFKAEIKQVTGVKQVCSASGFPAYSRMNTTSVWENGKPAEESIKTVWLFADHDYITTLELRIIAGRNFNANGNDKPTGAIINESTAGAFGWTAEEAIGKRIAGFTFSDSLPGQIIGVIKDFHISPLRREIPKLIIGYSDEQIFYMVRLSGTNAFQARKEMDAVAGKFMNEHDFESRFIEEAIEESYGAERKTGELLTFFTILAILIGCSGLYALSAYEAEQRIKELGIRKIMGASARQLLFLLSRDFLKLIVISLFVAMPLAYFLGNVWLGTYPYRVSWSADIFIFASLFLLALGWLTILTQAIKASRLNPVDALRYE